MADAVCAVSNKLGGRGSAFTIDGLGPSAAGSIGGVPSLGEAEDVGPLLKLLVVVGIAKGVVRGSVEAVLWSV